MRVLRVVARWLGRLLALVVVLALVALAWIHTSWGRNWLKRQILAAIAPRVDGVVTIDALEGSPLRTPSLRGVRLVDREHHELVSAGRVTVDYGLFPLTVRSIRVDAPVVHLVQDAQGEWGLPRALTAKRAKTPAGAPSAPLTIGALAVAGGSLDVTPFGQPTTTLTGLAASGRLEATRLVVDSLRGHWQEGDRDVVAGATLGLGEGAAGRLDAHAALGASRVEIHDAALGGLDALAGSLHAEVAGDDWRRLVPALPPGLTATIDVQLVRTPALEAIVTGAAHGLPVVGEATLSGEASFDASASRWQGRVAAASRSPVLPASATIEGGVVVAGRTLALEAVKLHAETPGIVQPKWAIGASTIDGTLAGLVPDVTLDTAVVVNDVQWGTQAVGKVNGRARVWDLGHAAEATVHLGDARKELEADVHVALARDAAGAITLRMVDARARTRRLRWTGAGGEITLADGTLRVNGVRMRSPAGRIDVTGELHMVEKTKHFRLELDDVDLARLREGLVLPGLPAQGILSGSVTISRAPGATVVPSVVFAADVQNLAPSAKAPPMKGRVDINISGERATVTAKFTDRGMALEATLSARVPSLQRLSAENIDQARIKGHGIDLARLWVTLGWKSQLVGRVTTLDVSLSGRKGKLSAHVEGLRPSSASQAWSGDLDGELAGGVVTLHARGGDADFGTVDATVAANAPGALFDAKAWARSLPGALRTVHVTATRLDLEAAQALLGQPLRLVGKADVVAELPAGARGADVQLTLRDAGLFGTDLRGEASLHAKVSSGTLSVDGSVRLPFASVALGLTARAPAVVTDGRAWAALDDRALTSLRVSSEDVALTALVPPAWGVRRGVGAVKLTIEKAGAPLVVDAALRDLQVGTLHRQLVATLHAEVDETSTKVHLDSAFGRDPLVHGDGSLAAGRAVLRAGHAAPLLAAAAQAGLHVDGFPLATVLDEAELPLALATSLAGKVHAEGTLTGSIAAPTVHASLKLLGASVAAATYDLDAVWDHQPGRTHMTLDVKQGQGGTLHVGLTTARRGGQGGGVRLTASNFRLAALTPLLHAAGFTLIEEADGVLSGQVRAEGDPAAPTIEGGLTISNGTLRLGAILPRLTGVQLKVTRRGDKLAVNGEAHSDSGKLQIRDGEVVLENYVPKRVHMLVHTEKLLVDIAGLSGIADLDADVTIKHDRAQRHWDITARLADSKLNLLTGSSAYNENEDIHVERKAGPSEAVELHILTDKDKGALVRVIDDLGELGKLDVYAKLWVDLTSENGELTTAYQVTVDHGTYLLRGNKYALDDRTQLQSHPGDSSPTIWAAAVHQFRAFNLTINVSGTLDEMEIAPTSDPPNSREFLFQVMLGQDPDDPDAGRSTLSQSAMGAAANTLLQRLAPGVADRLSLGFDEVGDTSAPSTRYKLRYKLYKNVFVTWRHRTTIDPTKNPDEAFAEWQIKPYMVLQGVVGTGYADSADLIFLWRWGGKRAEPSEETEAPEAAPAAAPAAPEAPPDAEPPPVAPDAAPAPAP